MHNLVINNCKAKLAKATETMEESLWLYKNITISNTSIHWTTVRRNADN